MLLNQVAELTFPAAEEMEPAWFSLNNIPYERVWPDDKYWLPLVLQEKCVKATFVFGTDKKTIIEQVIDDSVKC